MLPIDTTKLQFNWPNARAMAEAAAEAYKTIPFQGERLPILISDNRTSVDGFVQDRGNCIVIGFRGSKDPQDFIQDAKFLMSDLVHEPSGEVAQVHSGFLEDFEAIRERVVQALKNILAGRQMFIAGVYTFGCPRVGNKTFAEIYNGSSSGAWLGGSGPAGVVPVFIGGHSLGGGLATLCAIKLAEIFGFDATARLGDATFNLTNACDPVPLLPPLLAGYRDNGHEIFLPATGNYDVDPFIGTEIVSDILGMLDSWRRHKLAFLPKHFIATYQQRIQLLT